MRARSTGSTSVASVSAAPSGRSPTQRMKPAPSAGTAVRVNVSPISANPSGVTPATLPRSASFTATVILFDETMLQSTEEPRIVSALYVHEYDEPEPCAMTAPFVAVWT